MASIGRRRHALDPFAPIRWLHEPERVLRDGEQRLVETATLFLVGAECPFGCVFCDLWQHTLPGATPRGAIPTQIEATLQSIRREGHGVPETIKLYNASNYFEERAVPAVDDEAIVGQLAGARRVVVECHPRLVRKQRARCLAFAERLGRQDARLEVAFGLECTDPEIFPRLRKGCEVEEFASAARWLTEIDVALRAFVLVGLPWLQGRRRRVAVERTVEHAVAMGCETITLIPLRPTASLHEIAPEATAPSLSELDEIFARVSRRFDVRWGGPVIVGVDLWDLDRLPSCRVCGSTRRERLDRQATTLEAVSPLSRCERCVPSAVDQSTQSSPARVAKRS